MSGNPRTYLVGRSNSTIPCDIAIPASETSVSRKHLELTVTADGRYYVVHVHSRNKTKAYRDGRWTPVAQDFVELDTPLRLGEYETTVRHLLGMLAPAPAQPEVQPEPQPASPPPENGGGYQWDPDAGTIVRRPR